jgi:hypothetical protein
MRRVSDVVDTRPPPPPPRRSTGDGGAPRGPSRPRRSAPRARRWLVGGIAAIAMTAAAVVAVGKLVEVSAPPAVSDCHATVGSSAFVLDLAQAQHATTIAAVGKRMGLPDHAVTIALAAALQESRLHNLDHGDLDSLGLFQQRPSQGWGTAAQVLTPSYAAAAFYEHLSRVPGWATLPVTVAAQKVQRSGAPAAYADWELEARAIAQALTGEVPAGLTCRLVNPPGPAQASAPLDPVIATELGAAALGTPVDAARGWTVATWLVGHAAQYGITAVSFGGQRWDAASGHWRPDATATATVQLTRPTAR